VPEEAPCDGGRAEPPVRRLTVAAETLVPPRIPASAGTDADSAGRLLELVPKGPTPVWGRDPAYGSGPLATVSQDLLSILAYFAVAVVLVT
jgi:hypothetical protein